SRRRHTRCYRDWSSDVCSSDLETAHDARIIVTDEVLSRGQIGALYHLCDCYVSLHRSEGFGLTPAEAMAMGKPVIATGYGGNTRSEERRVGRSWGTRIWWAGAW